MNQGLAKAKRLHTTTAFVIAVMFAVGIPSVALAQGDRGTITGTISDPGGAVVPNAAITAINTETGARFETVSTATGNYTIVSSTGRCLQPGGWSPGFGKFVQQGIRVQVAITARIDVALQVSSTSESVVVTADAPLFEDGKRRTKPHVVVRSHSESAPVRR